MPDRRLRTLVTLVTFLALATPPGLITRPAPAEAQLFYCPDRPVDRQYTAEPSPGCVPLVDKDKQARSRRDANRPRTKSVAPVDLADLQGTIVRFLERYNRFVGCCADDSDQLDRVEDLAAEADRLLDAAQGGMSSGLIQARGMTMRELIGPVTRASRNLKELMTRLERLQGLQAQVFASDYETAGRLKRQIAEEQDALRQRFQPLRLPKAGRTGAGIQDTSLPSRVGVEGGDDTTLPRASGQAPDLPGGETETLGPRKGAGIGQAGRSGSQIGQTPSTGFGIGGSSGPTGESDLPTRAGPAIGE